MKYKFEHSGNREIDHKGATFTPFKVTIEIETPEDAVRFHDNIARHIPGKPCEFIGEAYCRIYGKGRKKSEGEI